MSISPLAQLALAQVPARLLPVLSLQEKTVIHYEICDNVRLPRGYTHTLINEICNCPNFGRCLCYLNLIRDVQIDQFWGDPSAYVKLSDWYPVTSLA